MRPVRKILAGYAVGPQAAAFLARAPGLNNVYRRAYAKLINGLVADGVWTKLDALWVLAAQDATTAALNLTSASFGLTPVNSPAFAPGQGYTGNGSSTTITTGYAPASGATYLQDSATIGAYIRNSRGASNNGNIMGTVNSGGTIQLYISPLQTSTIQYDVNQTTFPNVANTDCQGHWIASRTASNLVTLYKNGSSFGTNANASSATTTLTNQLRLISNSTSAGAASGFSSDQLGAAHIGAGLSAAEAAALAFRINAYMAAVGANVY